MKTEIIPRAISAARELRAGEKTSGQGPLTGDVLQEVIAENDKINHSEEAQSNDIEKQDKAYAEKQGISGILSVISSAFSAYRDFDYFAADNVSSEEVDDSLRQAGLRPERLARFRSGELLAAGKGFSDRPV